MVVAGHSAGLEGRRLRAQAAEHQRMAAALSDEAERWLLASRTEKSVAGSLAVLATQGYTFLHDRAWPGSRSGAQIDHVLVGPGGLYIVDTKAWKDVTVENGRIYRGQADVTDELDGLADVGYGTQAVMAEVGLAPGEVHVLVVLAGSSMAPVDVGSVVVVGERRAALTINSRGTRLSQVEVDTVLAAALAHFPALGGTRTEIDVSIRPVAVPASEPEPLFSVDDITEVLLAAALAEPIESWMSFLHPTQARLVRRSFNGPSRIRGAAGTGKTVVGLHRAAYLARMQPERVLVTSFVKTLPDVLAELLRRLAPESAHRVDFVGAHAFALRLLRERGVRLNLDPAAAEAAFTAVWRRHGLGGELARIDADQRYWRDEISKVIKGRGLTSFDEYAGLVRTGRRRALTTAQRRVVWDLFVAYEEALTAKAVCDYDDVILRAEASLRARPLERYGAVIIDEAQDLSCAMVRMLHLLVGDRPDGLTVIGDGQQTIYPGGFSLAEAGVSIAGRAVVMTTNYRNTREIMQFAARTVEGDEVADIDGDVHAQDEADIPRSGPAPTLRRYRSRRAHDDELLARLRSIPHALADVGILSLTTHGVAQTAALLRGAGVPFVDLSEYAGRPVDAVKIGTVKRAKGLEFKSVLLPRVRPALLEVAGRDDEAHVIHRRELYVAMTRARDELWVGVCD